MTTAGYFHFSLEHQSRPILKLERNIRKDSLCSSLFDEWTEKSFLLIQTGWWSFDHVLTFLFSSKFQQDRLSLQLFSIGLFLWRSL